MNGKAFDMVPSYGMGIAILGSLTVIGAAAGCSARFWAGIKTGVGAGMKAGDGGSGGREDTNGDGAT